MYQFTFINAWFGFVKQGRLFVHLVAKRVAWVGLMLQTCMCKLSVRVQAT